MENDKMQQTASGKTLKIAYRNFDIGFTSPFTGRSILARISIPSKKDGFGPPEYLFIYPDYAEDVAVKIKVEFRESMLSDLIDYVSIHQGIEEFDTYSYTPDKLLAELLVLSHAEKPGELHTLAKNVLYHSKRILPRWHSYIKALKAPVKTILDLLLKVRSSRKPYDKTAMRDHIMEKFAYDKKSCKRAEIYEELVENMNMVRGINCWIKELDNSSSEFSVRDDDFPFE